MKLEDYYKFEDLIDYDDYVKFITIIKKFNNIISELNGHSLRKQIIGF